MKHERFNQPWSLPLSTHFQRPTKGIYMRGCSNRRGQIALRKPHAWFRNGMNSQKSSSVRPQIVKRHSPYLGIRCSLLTLPHTLMLIWQRHLKKHRAPRTCPNSTTSTGTETLWKFMPTTEALKESKCTSSTTYWLIVAYDDHTASELSVVIWLPFVQGHGYVWKKTTPFAR